MERPGAELTGLLLTSLGSTVPNTLEPFREKRQVSSNATKWDVSQPIAYWFFNDDRTFLSRHQIRVKQSLSAAWQENIRRSLRYISNETCIRFQERGGSAWFLAFSRVFGYADCHAGLGRNPYPYGGRTDVYIADTCQVSLFRRRATRIGRVKL